MIFTLPYLTYLPILAGAEGLVASGLLSKVKTANVTPVTLREITPHVKLTRIVWAPFRENKKVFPFLMFND